MVKSTFLSNYGKTGDFLWDSTNITIMNGRIECNTGIIAACLPCLKPLFKSILGNSRAYGSSQSNSYSLHKFRPGDVPGSKNHTSVVVSHVTTKSMNSQCKTIKANISEESILPLQNNNITKTTVVTIDSSSLDEHSERIHWSRKHDVALERRVEDRV